MKIKKKSLKTFFYSIFLIIIILISFIYLSSKFFTVYHSKNKFYYSEYRGKTKYELSLISHNDTFDIYKINFESRPFLKSKTMIYGYLLTPKNEKKHPGIVLLPGGGVSKETELGLATTLVKEGYTVITFDQRGIGETGGQYPGFEQDAMIFQKGDEPIQHLSVYDALTAFDVLKKTDNIDKDNIIMMGESMGGRYAIIATAMDKRIKGVVGISTSGFDIANQNILNKDYFLSIDPDNYINSIKNRKVIMIHSKKDPMISINNALNTFEKANEPKNMFIIDECGHGYCEEMRNDLFNGIKMIINDSDFK